MAGQYSGRMNYGGIIDGSLKPLWTVQLEDDDEFLEWAKSFFDATRDQHRERTQRDLANNDFYMGIQSIALGKDGIPRDREQKPLDKFTRVVINDTYDLIEQWVSKMTRFPPAIAVIPPNDEHNDRIASQMSKDFIDYIFYQNDFDSDLEECARICRIEGEIFQFINYDRSKGDYHPDWQKSQELGIRVPLLNSAGEEVVGEDGNPLYIEKAQRVGDVDYETTRRMFVICEPKMRWKDVDYLIKIEVADIDELKAQHPDKADEIGEDGILNFLDTFECDKQLNEMFVFKLYHRSTEFLSSGRYIKFVEGCVLENKTLKEEVGHDELPCARLVNIQRPGELHGYSMLENLKLLAVMKNNFASIAYTNAALGAHLYWMVPRQAQVDLKKLKNGASVITFNGGFQPQIQQYKTIGEELWKGMEYFENQELKIAAIQPTSRGDVPPGIEAGIALAFLEEQENQRANVDIKRHNEFIKKVARLSLATAGSFYKPDDGRTLRIVGKNNSFSIKALDVAKLGGPYDIRVQRTTALSESKSGRLSQLLALEGRYPGLLPREQVLDMLDLSNDQKFYDLATSAIRAQEFENERMMEGETIEDAVDYEDHVMHLYTILKFMQTSSFKQDTPEPVKMMFKKHGMSHEYFIHKKMSNPVYAQRVMAAVPDFPTFTLPTPAPVMPQVPGAAPNGAAPQGGLPLPPTDSGEAEPQMPGEQAASPDSLPTPAAPPSEQPSPPAG